MSELDFIISTNADVSAEQLLKVATRQLPYALLRTTHDLAFAVRDDVYFQMKQSFHKPTPWTLSSMVVLKGDDKTNPASWVGLKTSDVRKIGSKIIPGVGAEHYSDKYSDTLKHHFIGGSRPFKNMEKAFYRLGLLPPGMIIVPGEACPLDAYDNPKHGFIVQMLSYFQAFQWAGYTANMTVESKKRFENRLGKKVAGAGVSFFYSKGKGSLGGSGKPNNLPAGIWMKTQFHEGTNLKPVFLFVKEGSYEQRFDIEKTAQEVVSVLTADIFAIQWTKAMANDRLPRPKPVVNL